MSRPVPYSRLACHEFLQKPAGELRLGTTVLNYVLESVPRRIIALGICDWDCYSNSKMGAVMSPLFSLLSERFSSPNERGLVEADYGIPEAFIISIIALQKHNGIPPWL
jgi:hypothetical protein